MPVQCKRYGAGHAVGSPELQQFSGALRRVQAQRGVFITTSRFTPAAVAWARKEGIHLIDGDALARWQTRLWSRAPLEMLARVPGAVPGPIPDQEAPV